MKITDVRELKIEQVVDSELPHRVELIGKDNTIYGAGITLSSALMRAFSVSKMWPTEQFPAYTNRELARFIFWHFDGGKNWVEAIKALEQA